MSDSEPRPVARFINKDNVMKRKLPEAGDPIVVPLQKRAIVVKVGGSGSTAQASFDAGVRSDGVAHAEVGSDSEVLSGGAARAEVRSDEAAHAPRPPPPPPPFPPPPHLLPPSPPPPPSHPPPTPPVKRSIQVQGILAKLRAAEHAATSKSAGSAAKVRSGAEVRYGDLRQVRSDAAASSANVRSGAEGRPGSDEEGSDSTERFGEEDPGTADQTFYVSGFEVRSGAKVRANAEVRSDAKTSTGGAAHAEARSDVAVSSCAEVRSDGEVRSGAPASFGAEVRSDAAAQAEVGPDSKVLSGDAALAEVRPDAVPRAEVSPITVSPDTELGSDAPASSCSEVSSDGAALAKVGSDCEVRSDRAARAESRSHGTARAKECSDAEVRSDDAAPAEVRSDGAAHAEVCSGGAARAEAHTPFLESGEFVLKCPRCDNTRIFVVHDEEEHMIRFECVCKKQWMF